MENELDTNPQVRTMSERYPLLNGEGVHVNYNFYFGDFVDAEKAEACIKRLYEHIERLTEAHGSDE